MSDFVVSARKYRPKKFSEVIGQEHVTKTLKNALAKGTLAHAFLFCGPRGVGKTTCARILAKAVNCTNQTADFEPCGSCESCLAFDSQSSMSILELDAASNNSVEHIRALNEQVRIPPQSGLYKVFIIDEVHMLSQSAFNAFLKTLEEPPSYAIFILATTEKHKIIPTILSRCQIFDFKRIHVKQIIEYLKLLCEQEEIQYDDEALYIIATKADGALRDALSIFDKIASFGGKEIRYQQTIDNLNILDYDYYFRFVEHLITEHLEGVLLLFNEIVSKGFEGDIFLSGFAEHLRHLLVSKHKGLAPLMHASDNLVTRYQEQANLVQESSLLSYMDIINQCEVDYKLAKNKSLHVEMALIKMTYIHRYSENRSAEIAAKKKPKSELAEHRAGSGTVISTTKPVDSKPTEIKKEPPKIKINSSFKEKQVLSSKSVLPAFKSLDQLLEKAGTSKLSEQVQGKELQLDEVIEAWNHYSMTQESQTVRSVLDNTELQVRNGGIIAKVGSSISKAVILQETKLIEQLRNALGLPRLTMQIEVDKTKVQLGKPKILSTKERFELMMEKNPLLSKFRDQFDLKIDNL